MNNSKVVSINNKQDLNVPPWVITAALVGLAAMFKSLVDGLEKEISSRPPGN